MQPSDADQKVTWSSSNTNLVTVDGTGKLTAAKDNAEKPSGKQTVTITVSSVNAPSVKATCTVTVDNEPASKISSILTMLQSLFTSFIGVLNTLPLKEYSATLIDFVKKIIEILPQITKAA